MATGSDRQEDRSVCTLGAVGVGGIEQICFSSYPPEPARGSAAHAGDRQAPADVDATGEEFDVVFGEVGVVGAGRHGAGVG